MLLTETMATVVLDRTSLRWQNNSKYSTIWSYAKIKGWIIQSLSHEWLKQVWNKFKFIRRCGQTYPTQTGMHKPEQNKKPCNCHPHPLGYHIGILFRPIAHILRKRGVSTIALSVLSFQFEIKKIILYIKHWFACIVTQFREVLRNETLAHWKCSNNFELKLIYSNTSLCLLLPFDQEVLPHTILVFCYRGESGRTIPLLHSCTCTFLSFGLRYKVPWFLLFGSNCEPIYLVANR